MNGNEHNDDYDVFNSYSFFFLDFNINIFNLSNLE